MGHKRCSQLISANRRPEVDGCAISTHPKNAVSALSFTPRLKQPFEYILPYHSKSTNIRNCLSAKTFFGESLAQELDKEKNQFEK
jgi:hypothetical protein